VHTDPSVAVGQHVPQLEDRAGAGEITNIDFLHIFSIPGSVNRLAP
jgi:hypothetical protein